MFGFGKVTPGVEPTVSNTLFVATISIGDKSVNVYQVNSNKLKSLYGVTTDIATARMKMDGVTKEVILIGHKFYDRYNKNYQQDLLFYKFYKIVNKGKPQVYECDNEIQILIDAMVARDKLGLFGRRSFVNNIDAYNRKLNKSIAKVAKFEAKETKKSISKMKEFEETMDFNGQLSYTDTNNSGYEYVNNVNDMNVVIDA